MKDARLKRIGKLINFFAIFFPRSIAKLILYKFTRPLSKHGFGVTQQDYLQSKSSLSFLTIAQKKVAFYHWPGKGPKILLCHGWESNSSRWEPLIKLLQKHGFDVYAFDAPAHGFSEGKSISPVEFIEVIHQIDLEQKFHAIIGHSYGGFNALFFASKYPNHLEKIIAIAPTNSVADVVTGMQNKMGFSDKVIEHFKLKFKKRYEAMPSAFRSEEFVTKITSAGLIIHDIDDPILPFKGSKAIHEAWDGSELIQTSGLGHRVKSQTVNEHIIRFLS